MEQRKSSREDGHRISETSLANQFKKMKISIQISDSVYKSLLAGGNRVQGSIGLVSPTEGNFNAHRRRAYEKPDTKFIKLAHGRASVSEERVSLNIRIDRSETDVVPYIVIDEESQEASDFVYANL